MDRHETPAEDDRRAALKRLLTVTELAESVRVSTSTIWRRVADGTLPMPIYPSPGCPRWRPAEILAVREALIGCRPPRRTRNASQPARLARPMPAA